MIALAFATIVSLGVEALHDDSRYHFDNPSSWDTPQPVPHFYEQRYSGTKEYLVLRARTPRWSVEGAVSGVKHVRGSDYDTFFQPTGDVVVHGSTTDVDTRSWRIAARTGFVGIAYSHDAMRFPASISTTTHTMPPSSESSLSTTRENTASDVIELRTGIERSRDVTPDFRVRGGVDLAPLTVARLTTNLPDKYAQPVRSSAIAFGARATAEAEWHADRWGVGVRGELGHTWRFTRAKAFTRQQAGVAVAVSYQVQ